MNPKERGILRSLAEKQLEVSRSDKNARIVQARKKLNRCERGTPLIHIEPDNFAKEIITPLMLCESEQARRLEHDLRFNLINHDFFDDDTPVPDYFGIKLPMYFHPFGYDISSMRDTSNLGKGRGYHIGDVIGDLRDDFEKLNETTFGVDEASARSYQEIAADVFGDILPVKLVGSSLKVTPTYMIVFLMGMQNMYIAMIDYPDDFKRVMRLLTDDYLRFFRMLERGGFILPTTEFEQVHMSSFAFTDELPNDTAGRTTNIWGYLNSQESVGISPGMYAELVFPYYREIAEQFGLLSYGCCEASEAVWEQLKTLKNLRKVSVPFCSNEERMGELLRGGKIVYQRKPDSKTLGLQIALDEDFIRKHISRTLRAARGCALEITQREVFTIHGDAGKVKRYVQIIRECIEKEWQ